MEKNTNKNRFKKFKILGVLNSYFTLCPGECPVSGGEKRFFEVVRRWNKEGLDIEILTTSMGHNTCIKHQLNVTYKILPFSIVDNLGVVGTYFFRTLIACFLTPKFQNSLIIYTATDIIPDIIPAIMTKIFNKKSKMICTVFHLVPHYFRRTGSKVNNFISYYAQVVSFILIRIFADLLFVDNSMLKGDLINKYNFSKFPSDRIIVSSLGVNKEYIDRISSNTPGKYDGFFLGRLHVSKGIFDLIEIWRLVVEKNKNAKLAICGTASTEMLKRLNQKINNYDLKNNISLLGFLDEEEVFKNLKSSRVFVFPSHEEGWGISVCEAMACKLPVVAYDLPVFKEVFPKGLIAVKMGDQQLFADTILELLSDKAKYDMLSQDAIDVASQYSWDDVAIRELFHIEKVIIGG